MKKTDRLKHHDQSTISISGYIRSFCLVDVDFALKQDLRRVSYSVCRLARLTELTFYSDDSMSP